jgi:hypothetical protein
MRTEEYIERIVYHNVPLDDGRVVVLFVNRESGLIVLDIVDKDEQGGVEVYRAHAKPFKRQEDTRNANHVDGYDRDDLGESPDY